MVALAEREREAGAGEFMTAREVAAVLRVSSQTVYRYIWSDELPGYRVGKKWLVKRSDLEALIGE